MQPSIEFLNILTFCFIFCIIIKLFYILLLHPYSFTIREIISKNYRLKITDYFCPPSSPKIVKWHFYALSQNHLNYFPHNFMCELSLFHLFFLFNAFFFSFDMVILFAFYLEQHLIVCRLKFTTKGSRSLSHCPVISLKHVSSYHKTCRIVCHLMEFKVLLVYNQQCLLSPV